MSNFQGITKEDQQFLESTYNLYCQLYDALDIFGEPSPEMLDVLEGSMMFESVCESLIEATCMLNVKFVREISEYFHKKYGDEVFEVVESNIIYDYYENAEKFSLEKIIAERITEPCRNPKT